MASPIFKFAFLLIIIQSLKAAEIYMATDGNDSSGDGSISKPYKTLMKCQEKANSGDKVIIRGGTYKNFDISDSDTNYNYFLNFQKVELLIKVMKMKMLFLILNLVQNIN